MTSFCFHSFYTWSSSSRFSCRTDISQVLQPLEQREEEEEEDEEEEDNGETEDDG